MQDITNFLTLLYDNSGARCITELKKHPDIVEYLITKYGNIPLNQLLYCGINDYTDTNVCYLGKLKKFKSIKDGYRKFCDKANNCQCLTEHLSKKSKLYNSSISTEQRHQINEKTRQTNRNKYGVDYASSTPEFREKTKQTNLERYGVEYPIQNNAIREKTKQTNLDRYGVEYVTSANIVREKIKNTNLERYGVEHPFDSIEIRNKTKQTYLSRHGEISPFHNANVQNTIAITRLKNYYNRLSYRVNNRVIPLFDVDDYEGIGKKYNWQCNTCASTFLDHFDDGRVPRCPRCYPINSSHWEQEIKNFVESNKLFVDANNRHIIPPLELDIYLPDHNIAIECNGVYWHSELQGKDKKYHLNKTDMCQKQGIKLIHVWDYEWYYHQEIVKSRLMSQFHMNTSIYARKCILKTVSAKEKILFLETNHIQGPCPSSINIGLYYEDELVSLMTFGKSRFNKTIQYELLRYCTKQHVNITGGASKLLAYFKKTYNPTSIISYADRRWSDGNMYKTLQFEFSHNSNPNYKYTDNYKKFYNRVKFQKHKLKKLLEVYDPNITEWENMQLNGYDRVWDCGNSVWIWRNE